MDVSNFLKINQNNIHFINEVKVFNEIQNNKKIIILDLRSKSDFDKLSLPLALNLPYDELDYSFFQQFDENEVAKFTEDIELKNKVFKYKRYFIAIIMSQAKIKRSIIRQSPENWPEDLKEQILKSLLLYQSLVNLKIREMGLFNLGFEKFVSYYSFLFHNNLCVKSPMYVFV